MKSNLQSPPITLSSMNTSATGTGLIISHQQSDDYFYVQMDLSQFRPDDLKVCSILEMFQKLLKNVCIESINDFGYHFRPLNSL